MINLPKLSDVVVKDKIVLVRADVDVGETLEVGDDVKLLTNKKTLEYLVDQKAKVIIIGHRGRPEGKVVGNLSLAPIAERLGKVAGLNIKFIYDIVGTETQKEVAKLVQGSIIFLENLRFDSREEANDEGFTKSLAGISDIYINEAFSSSAKEHASIVGVPKLLPHAAGFHFAEEVTNLSKVLENPGRPVVVIISGVKEDKLSYIEPFSKFADKILIAGKLPELLENSGLPLTNSKLVIAKLNPDKEDITIHSIEKFDEEIKKAGTLVVGGPVGKYEEEGHRLGTQRVFEAVANSGAFKVAGGGDTEQAINLLGLYNKFDWVSVGGGAMLDFFAKGTLPGIEALLH